MSHDYGKNALLADSTWKTGSLTRKDEMSKCWDQTCIPPAAQRLPVIEIWSRLRDKWQMLQLVAILADMKIFSISIALLLNTVRHEMNETLPGTNREYTVIFYLKWISVAKLTSVSLWKEHFIPKSAMTAVKMCSEFSEPALDLSWPVWFMLAVLHEFLHARAFILILVILYLHLPAHLCMWEDFYLRSAVACVIQKDLGGLHLTFQAAVCHCELCGYNCTVPLG